MANSPVSIGSSANWRNPMDSTPITVLPGGALSPDNPFPGLRPFQESDAAWFFGRGQEINDLLKRLRRVRFLAVVGPSGYGKSSLIKAGVLAGLHDGYLDAQWKIASFQPGERPLDNLANALQEGEPSDSGVGFASMLQTLVSKLSGSGSPLRKILDRGSMGVLDAVRAQNLPPDTNLLILVDQFEELFQFVERRGETAREEAKAFLKLLLAAAVSDDTPVYIVITMRLEWLNECATYIGLAEAINEGIYLVPQMSRRQFREVILEPIEAANGSITATLLDRMLNDLDGRTDQLPVLQHALMRLWQRRQPGEPIGILDYDKVGTFSACLSSHAQEIFSTLDVSQQKAVEGLFRSITQVVKNRKVRRPRPLGEIAAETQLPLEQLKKVVETFRQEGRSFLVATGGELTEQSIVDISHEALIRQWKQLSQWVDDEADIQARIGRLEETAAEWNKDRGLYKAALYRGLPLERAEKLQLRLKPGSVARDFLRASRRAERWRWWLWRIATGAIIVAVIAVLIYRSRIAAAEAEAARRLADQAVQQSHRDQQLHADLDQVLAQVQQVKTRIPNASLQALQATVSLVQANHVYLQYAASAQLDLAKSLQNQLTKLGYVVAGLEAVGSKSPAETQIRYFRPADKNGAQKIASALGTLINGPIVLQPMPDPKSIVPPGQYEIWLSPTAQAVKPQN
jgi:hypothetical protein